MEKNSKKTFSKLQINSTLLIVGLISPLLLYFGLSGEIPWLTCLASVLIVGSMLAVILIK
jgi:cytochrome c oxidase subunit IV